MTLQHSNIPKSSGKKLDEADNTPRMCREPIQRSDQTMSLRRKSIWRHGKKSAGKPP